MGFSRADDSPQVEKVRELARLGQLTAAHAKASGTARLELRRGVYEIARQVVFQRITVEVERRRQHGDCGQGPSRLRPECLDRFHDAVEAVINDTLRKADTPILRLDAWMASRAKAATINDHRARRGRVGAQQKPYVPQWLRKELGEDPWLIDLALAMLTWVGIPDTAGPGMWPVDSWADRRTRVTGEHQTSDLTTVWREIDRVLEAMRHKPDWYAKYIERPLDRKPLSVAPFARTDDGEFLELTPLELVNPTERHDGALWELAARCLDVIRVGLTEPGRDPVTVVREAIQLAFCAEQLDPAQPPHAVVDPDVDEILSDPAAVERIVDVVFDIFNIVRPDDTTNIHRRPDDAADAERQLGDLADARPRPGDATDVGRRPGDPTDAGHRPGDGTDPGRRPSDLTDARRRSGDPDDAHRRPAG